MTTAAAAQEVTRNGMTTAQANVHPLRSPSPTAPAPRDTSTREIDHRANLATLKYASDRAYYACVVLSRTVKQDGLIEPKDVIKWLEDLTGRTEGKKVGEYIKLWREWKDSGGKPSANVKANRAAVLQEMHDLATGKRDISEPPTTKPRSTRPPRRTEAVIAPWPDAEVAFDHPPASSELAPPPADPVRVEPPTVEQSIPAPDEGSVATPNDRAADEPSGRWRLFSVTNGFFLIWIMSLGVALDTSWQFFHQKLGMHGVEGAVLFAVVEFAQVVLGLAMRKGVRQNINQGAATALLWFLTFVAGYIAVVLTGPVEGFARVAVGPVLGLVMLHLALGIEFATHNPDSKGMWAIVSFELRQRTLSRFGLADDRRDALQRIRERKAMKVAKLSAEPKLSKRNQRKLQKAVAQSGIANDPELMSLMRRNRAAIQYVGTLCATKEQANPFGQDDHSAT